MWTGRYKDPTDGWLRCEGGLNILISWLSSQVGRLTQPDMEHEGIWSNTMEYDGWVERKGSFQIESSSPADRIASKSKDIANSPFPPPISNCLMYIFQIAKYICSFLSLDLWIFENVSVQMEKFICPNCKCTKENCPLRSTKWSVKAWLLQRYSFSPLPSIPNCIMCLLILSNVYVQN